MRLEKLLERLRSLVDDHFVIELKVNVRDYRGDEHAEVIIVHHKDQYCWTRFSGKTIEEAMRGAIQKLRHPNKDYVDENGTVWKASERSVYGSEHIKRFLRKS